MKAYVLDASVAAMWFLPSAGEDLFVPAQEIRREFAAGRLSLLAPDLLWPEVGNVLWKATRRGRISAAGAEVAARALVDLALPRVSSEGLLRQAVAMAQATGRSVYDCVYVTLAFNTARPLLTADERLANALAARFPVAWLGAI